MAKRTPRNDCSRRPLPCRLVQELVYEKEKRLREAMKIMGLRTWVYWVSWFIKAALFLLISVILMTIIAVAGKVTQNSNGFAVFLFLFLYALSVIALAFFFSTLFNSSSVAASASGLLFFATYIPYFFLQNSYETTSVSAKFASCLLPTTCMGIGANILSQFESSGAGLQLSELNVSPSNDGFSMASVFGMLVVDLLLYLLLAWYIDAVKPGAYGIPKPLHFFLLPSYWCGSAKAVDSFAGMVDSHESSVEPGNVEQAPAGLKAGIELRALRKVFKNQTGGTKTAVDGLSLDMYEGQITALLGHNGAGKTTTMSMLVGLYPPSAGEAKVNGFNCSTQIAQVHEQLGLCPQFDTLFPSLSVDEHLYFYSRLKGVGKEETRREMDVFVADLGLERKRHAATQTLSGGQRRAVSAAIALVGGSKVVFLDEPTSGMDPYKRRQTWDLLLKHKEGRTIVLTTHFMDEADLLGDRIAIMAEGQLRTSVRPNKCAPLAPRRRWLACPPLPGRWASLPCAVALTVRLQAPSAPRSS